MSYESADYVNQLDVNLPKGTDSISEGDIHIRLLKEVLKQSFPNVSEPVNAIHTSDTEPTLHSPGTVWFDTSSGLVKMRDQTDSEWLNMAHGQADGLGSLLKISWFDLGDASGRWGNTWSEIFTATITPLSTTSSLIFEITGQAGCSGYGSREGLWGRIHNKTTGDYYKEVRLVGFQHVDDGGNFEIIAGFCGREMAANHGMGAFDIGIEVREENDSTSAGGEVSNFKLSVAEVE